MKAKQFVSPFVLVMLNNKYYNPVLVSALEMFFQKQDWQGLIDYIKGLSHKDFRVAGDIIGNSILPIVEPSVFWAAFNELLAYHSKAFLVTMLKSVAVRKHKRGFTLKDDGFIPVARFLVEQGSDVDRMKFVTNLLQVFTDEPDELEWLLKSLSIDNPRVCADYMLRGDSMANYYLLFNALRKLEHDKDYLMRCCVFLIKKGDSLSFNLASVLKTYFDLEQVKGTFSLTLNPYQMGRLEHSYENFSKIMRSI